MPRLARITIYPVKSLPGLELSSVEALPSGALKFDRRWAIVDADGQWVNGKRTSAIHRLRAEFDLAAEQVTLRAGDGGAGSTLPLVGDRRPLENWLSTFFGFAVRVEENSTHGFPDDTEAPGPTFIGTATIEAVAGWFPGLSLDSIRARFRANLEIGDVEPFWDDRLYAGAGEAVRFRVGKLEFLGVNPCQRCVVPTRSPKDGTVLPQFARIFAEKRATELPTWADQRRFDHYYRLAVNTRPAHFGGMLHVGDSVEIVDTAAV